MQRLGLRLSARQCDELFDTIDTNNDGAVDLHELLAWINAEKGTPAPIAATERSQMAAASVSQARATEEVAAAVSTVVRQQFGGSAETAFLYLLEVAPAALNQPEASQLAQGDTDDSDLSDSALDESAWRHRQQQHERERTDRCAHECIRCTIAFCPAVPD